MNILQFRTYLLERQPGQMVFDIPFLSSVAHNFDAVWLASIWVVGHQLQTEVFVEGYLCRSSTVFSNKFGELLDQFILENNDIIPDLSGVYVSLWCRHTDADYSTYMSCPLSYLLSADVPLTGR